MATEEGMIRERDPKVLGTSGGKVRLWLLPAVGRIYGALAAATGADKYGPYNWREGKINLTTYLSAFERHYLAILDGEWLDHDSGLPHLGHIIATAAILLDAWVVGTLVIDLPEVPGDAARILRVNEKRRIAVRISDTAPGFFEEELSAHNKDRR